MDGRTAPRHGLPARKRACRPRDAERRGPDPRGRLRPEWTALLPPHPRHSSPRPAPASAHRRLVPEARPHYGAAIRDPPALEALRILSVDNSVRLDGGDRTARQALAQYIARAPLPLQKLPDDRAGGRSCITPPVIPVSGRTRTRGAPLTSSLISLSSSPGEYAPSTPTGCSHAEPTSLQAEASEPTTVPHAACRSAWARLIVKVDEVDLSGGSPWAPRGWLRSGQREPVTLSSVWLRDETHRGHHRSWVGQPHRPL